MALIVVVESVEHEAARPDRKMLRGRTLPPVTETFVAVLIEKPGDSTPE
jgi:hypothetical protein